MRSEQQTDYDHFTDKLAVDKNSKAADYILVFAVSVEFVNRSWF